MKKYTIGIIGSGSAYTPGIVNSLLEQRKQIPIKKLSLLTITKKDCILQEISWKS